MSRIEVELGGIAAAGQHAGSAGDGVIALAGQARGVAAAGGGAPPATEAALDAAAAAWGAALAMLGDDIRGIGTAASAAGALYAQADSASMCPTGGG
jgi:hypothetical protein